ncbi:MAG TPA: hypothetical protein VN716_27620 [Vicinamibacterales bacterium]|nr:hypothetical protein [Vicinamibacterales bacterium]
MQFYMDEASGTIARPRELVIVSVAGLLLALLMTRPLATGLPHLGRTLGTDADGQYSIWNVAWVARAIVADPADLFDANIFFPHKTTLAYSEANLVEGIIGILPWWLSRNPWLTLNVVMLAAFTSAYAGAWLLLRHVSGDRGAAAAAAILYAFCPYVMSHLSHIQLLFTGGIPVALLLVLRLAEEAAASAPVASAFTRKLLLRGVALGAAIAVQGLACAYYGIFAGLMTGYAALVLAATRRLWTSRAYWIALGIGAATAILIIAPFFAQYLRVSEETSFVRSLDDAARYSARIWDYLGSASRAHAWLLGIARSAGSLRDVLFPGMLALVLGVAGLVLVLRRGGMSQRARDGGVVAASLGLIALWASFGPSAGLYRVLYYLPAFSFLRAPSRFGLIVVLALAVLASIALARLFAALPGRRRTLAAAIACALAVADITVIPIRWYRAPEIPAPYRVLADSPRGVVAEFPFYGERSAFPLHAQYMLFSTSHWMPLVNGYSDVIPLDFRQAAAVLDGFPGRDMFPVLARRRVRYIGIHWDMFVGRQEEIRQRLQPFLPYLRVLAADDRMTLYEIVRYPG